MTIVADYIDTNEFYRIPKPIGESERLDIEAAIAEGERSFYDTFGIAPNDDNLEAVKFFVFAFWLRIQSLRKTSAGASAKLNFTQSQNYADQTRRVTAYNRACEMMQRKDLKLIKIINY